MEVTIRRSAKGKVRKTGLDTLMEEMRKEQRLYPAGVFRHELDECMPGVRPVSAEKLPVIVFSGIYRNTPEGLEMKRYNGIILVEIKRLANRSEAIALRDRAAEILQTLAATIGSSGKSVKILTRFTLPDGTLPQGERQIGLFHAHAYHRAAVFYSEQLQHPVTLAEPVPEKGCRYTFDPGLYYNPDALPIRMAQPHLELAEAGQANAAKSATDPVSRLMPGYERYQVVTRLYNVALKNTLLTTPIPHAEADKQPFLVNLAEHCFRNGVPEEDAVRWTLLHSGLRRFETELRETIHNCYLLGKNFGGQPELTAGQRLMAQLSDFMERRYAFRHNLLKGDTEYREQNSFCFHFRPVTDEVVNTVSIQAQQEGIELWDRDVKRFIYSTQTVVYNPLDDYLEQLPAWDGKDRIRELADTLPTDSVCWRDRFYVWFLGMVAQWRQMSRMHANSVVPLLVGAQGCGKSTWCRSILPPELREYYAESLDFSSRREAELALGRFALICLDEFDSISANQQAFLKHLLQKPEVKTRQAYSQSIRSRKRFGTFIATCNNHDLLTDPTGSRRFLCIEIKGLIDNNRRICYDQLYAQAVEALQRGEQYWFGHDEEVRIMRDNLSFQQSTPEEQLFFQYYRCPEPDEKGKWLSTTEILLDIQKQSGLKISKTNMSTFGRILQKYGTAKKHTAHGNLWHVMKV